MNYSNFKIYMVMMLLGVMMFSSGCVSSLMLTAGKNQDDIFDSGSKKVSRASVENQIGAPVETKQLDKLPSADEFRMIENSIFEKRRKGELAVVQVYYDKLRGINKGCDRGVDANKAADKRKQAAHEPGTFVYARYDYKGRIISSERIYTNTLFAFGSWGLLEPVLIPAAAWTLATGHNRHNYIEVWYDDYGIIVAYTWFEQPSNKTTAALRRAFQ